MGQAKLPLPVKLFAGIIYSRERDFFQARGKLKERFGEVDFESQAFPFDKTDYYAAEMGECLKRKVLSFSQLIAPDELAEIKLFTNATEVELARKDEEGFSRSVNIDPGYLSMEKVVLATTKNYDHRPYLAGGIYADLTYRYRDRSYQPLEWTYPDYKAEEIVGLFNKLRQIYLGQLRAQ